ncbi:helix-turn-helix transcriptional regulator [Chitinophaga sp.]|uniref:helix-turn-helix domain-containing protein n=1 Tax=Chitinophaga sp. TaxID=1869181 RepID=UPI0031D324F8
MKEQSKPYHVKSILEEQSFWGVSKPMHPLVSIYRYNGDVKPQPTLPEYRTFGFYAISIKKNYAGKFKYGQRYYDFDSGVMTFIAPNQVLAFKQGDVLPPEGLVLHFHPDLLAGYPLSKTIKGYSYFSYEVNEALHLSEQEEEILENIFKNIEREYHNNIDKYSQDVIVAQIELLLQYSNRFYNRQFITRKIVNDEILIRLENVLTDCFTDENLSENGLPTVQFISEQLNVSPNYLSDMLRSITGRTTQQHIHDKLIEKAKELLTVTNLSVSEIAYQLGFEYPQSFNKLFKKKTDISPLEFRQSFK